MLPSSEMYPQLSMKEIQTSSDLLIGGTLLGYGVIKMGSSGAKLFRNMAAYRAQGNWRERNLVKPVLLLNAKICDLLKLTGKCLFAVGTVSSVYFFAGGLGGATAARYDMNEKAGIFCGHIIGATTLFYGVPNRVSTAFMNVLRS